MSSNTRFVHSHTEPGVQNEHAVNGPAIERSPVPAPGAERKKDAVRIGVIGYGYWGPNIVRNVSMLQNSELVAVCDKSAAALQRAQRLYPARPGDHRLQ